MHGQVVKLGHLFCSNSSFWWSVSGEPGIYDSCEFQVVVQICFCIVETRCECLGIEGLVCEIITFVETLLQVAVLRLEVLQLLSQILDQDLKPEILTIL